MRHFSKIHGKHCLLRAFQTECPKCGKEVLYWECTHGSKLFFEYPPYGKLIKHRCQKNLGKREKRSYITEIKTPQKSLKVAIFICDACGKIFKNNDRLNDHITQMIKFDYFHQVFKASLNQKKERTDVSEVINENKILESDYKPKFGKINLKKTRES